MQPAHVNDACIHLSFLANRLAVNGADWHSQGDRREICSSKFSAGRRRRSQRHVRRRRRGDGNEEELEGKGMERRDEADVCPRLPAARSGTGTLWRLPSSSGLVPLGRRRCGNYVRHAVGHIPSPHCGVGVHGTLILRRLCFFQIHFHFSYQSTTGLSVNHTITFPNLIGPCRENKTSLSG